jgi:cyclase
MKMQDSHCGEVLLCSIDRDGTMSGFDLEMIQKAQEELTVPLVASSGAGTLNHCEEAMNAGASAITISSMFFFTDHSPIKVRSYLYSRGLNVRASRNSRN